MAKPKSKQVDSEEQKQDAPSDIFSLLFSQQVGLGSVSTPDNGDLSKNEKKKKKKREMAEKSELDDTQKVEFGGDNLKKKKKQKGGKSDSGDTNGIEFVGGDSKKKKKREKNTEFDDGKSGLVGEGSEKKEKRKKSERGDGKVELVDEEKKGKKRDKEVSLNAGVELVEVEKKDKKRNKEVGRNVGVELGKVEKRKEEGERETGSSKKGKKVEEEEKSILDVGLSGISKVEKKEKSGEVVEDKKKRKKRKRDEIEEEYEARNYGALVPKKEGEVGKRVVGEKRKSVDNPAELMVSKEGFDDEGKLLRTIFVGNLQIKTKKKDLVKEFSKFGEVESVRIRSVPILDSKTPRKGSILQGKINENADSVHAYIVFKDEKSTQASLSNNMALVGGNHIRVDMACPPRKKLKGDSSSLYDKKRTIFVGNLPFDVKDEELYKLFCGIKQLESGIEAVRVIRDPGTSLGKGIAYVLFKTGDDANMVLKKKHLKLRDRDLRLSRTKSDATPSKKRTLPPSSANGTPAKRFSVSQAGSDSKTKTNLSYQGLQASKSNKRKDGFIKKTGGQGKQTQKTLAMPEVKQWKTKRPAVAARKAKALKSSASKQMGNDATSKQTGKRHKPETRTPESFKRNKKARRS